MRGKKRISEKEREKFRKFFEKQREWNDLLKEYGSDILTSDNFMKTKDYIQHGNMTVNSHCINVAIYSLAISRKLKISCSQRELVRGALLHDYFLYDWHDKGYVPERKRLHGFWHPGIALRNADKEYQLTDIQRDIIKKHMWPLTIVPPVCRESWVVTGADKYCSLMETLKLHKGHGKRYDFAAAKRKRDKEKQLGSWEKTGDKAVI